MAMVSHNQRVFFGTNLTDPSTAFLPLACQGTPRNSVRALEQKGATNSDNLVCVTFGHVDEQHGVPFGNCSYGHLLVVNTNKTLL